MNNNKIIDINKKSFLSIIAMLAALMIVSIIITYVVPKGTFGTRVDEFGNEIIDYINKLNDEVEFFVKEGQVLILESWRAE